MKLTMKFKTPATEASNLSLFFTDNVRLQYWIEEIGMLKERHGLLNEGGKWIY